MATDVDKAISDAWLLASADLDIRVTSPFILTRDGQDYVFIALVHDFGSQNGALVCAYDDWRLLQFPAKAAGLFCSGLGEIYKKYDRAEFIDTLQDWGWFGPSEERPAWYSGPSLGATK